MSTEPKQLPENPDVTKGYTTPIFDCYYCEMEKEEEPLEVGNELCCQMCGPKHTILCQYCGARTGVLDANEIEFHEEEDLESGFYCSDCTCLFIQRGKI